ncbi:hypothetical protein XELAEV_18027048mg [Xenopus laevis]|uniref:Uncharacterized protein n=1 Tax=Xenopus laevis TaxID=8355 RepID=A0A974CWY1_XENLA|nr:hypothetical protein XELAEV_18027048mg [Xenopus laevis]
MDFLDNLANKSKFKFDIPHSVMSDAEIWSDLYTQCMNANVLVERKDISFSRLKHKIQNVMLIVKTFNTLMCSERKENYVEKITAPDKREVECDRVSHDCLAKEISKHELRLSEIESVLQRNNQVSVITKEQRSMFVPDLNNPEYDYDRVDKDSGIIQEKVQAKQLDAQNGHSQCSIDRPVCPYKRPRAEDKRSYSLLMKTRNNY